MRRLQTFAVSGGLLTLFALGCGDGEPISGPDQPLQAKPAGAGLKVTPPLLNFSELGGTTTLTASSSFSPITVAVSDPACVSVSLKSEQQKQSKYTVTAIAAGDCTLTVTDGATGNVEVPVMVTVAPPLVAGTLAAGLFHTCGLDVNGAAWCWGYNGGGQLGNSNTVGSVTANPTPELVEGGLTFVSLTAGHLHTCGLTASGAAWCWGNNFRGQLGNLTNSGLEFARHPQPLPVDGNLTFSAIDAGSDHTCAITTEGLIHCWGSNFLGQLGTSTNNNVNAPNPTPTPVDGGLTFARLAAGAAHTCGVTTEGVVYCWGDNRSGQLGNPSSVGQENIAHPTPTAVQNLPPVVSLVASNHTCGLTSAGAAWCWGSNHVGQLGAPTAEINHPTPIVAGEGLNFLSLGAGGGHTCGVTSGGTAFCWGGNLLGQLGTMTNFGNNTPNYSPIAVAGLSLASLAIKAAHTCGLTAAGQAWCWGFNRYGQLGNMTNNDTDTGVPTPEAVLGGIVFATP